MVQLLQQPPAGTQSSRSAARWCLLYVLGASWLARIGFLWLTWGMRRSYDISYWNDVGSELLAGRNPYISSPYLNWPPLWMQVIWGLKWLHISSGIPFTLLVQITLIVAESLLVVAMAGLLRQIAPHHSPNRLLLYGISLNPICILLVCQHGNFDVLLALGVVLALRHLARWYDDRDILDWLLACLWLGLAILAKTIPLVLLPVLFAGTGGLPRKARYLGAGIVFGPVVLGMSILYVLSPVCTLDHVLLYRSQWGGFGLSGMLSLVAPREVVAPPYRGVFATATVIALMSLGKALQRRPALAPARAILLTALLLIAVPSLGPGYGPQYAFWFLPILVLSYACMDGAWRRLLAVTYGVAVVTYLIEYAFSSPLGALLHHGWPGQAATNWCYEMVNRSTVLVLLRLPLFACFVTILIAGGRRFLGECAAEFSAATPRRSTVKACRGNTAGDA